MNYYTYTGTPSLTKDIKHDGVPTGDLNPGDIVEAWPLFDDHPDFLWVLVNTRNNFTTKCPKHDLRLIYE